MDLYTLQLKHWTEWPVLILIIEWYPHVIVTQGMDIIESLDPKAFSEYIKKYQNTICGRHPIAVLLNVSAHDSACSLQQLLLYRLLSTLEAVTLMYCVNSDSSITNSLASAKTSLIVQ